MNRPPSLALVLILPVLSACHAETPYEKPITPVGVATASEASPGGAMRYSATVDAVMRVDLAFRVGGYVRTIGTVGDGRSRRSLREGDTVRRGTVLATVDPTDTAERVRQARAQLEEATAAAAQAERSLVRARALFDQDALARPELEAAQTADQAAKARVAAATAGVRQVESVAGDTTLVAPFDGILLRKQVNVGSLAMPGAPAFTLADITSVKAMFGVPDVVLPTVREAGVDVEVEAFAGATFPARLTNVSPAADPRGRVFDVELTIPNADGRLRPGMIASVTLHPPGESAPELLVPLSAITHPAGASTGYAVFVVESQGSSTVARQRLVELGSLRGNLVSVTSGLRRGERVVVSGTAMVTDGLPVRVVL